MRGRRRGTRVSYSDRQTRRYRSFALRKARALRLSPPTIVGTSYRFRPRRRAAAWYRTTSTLDQSELKDTLLTESHEIDKDGEPSTDWSYERLTFRWAASFTPAAPPERGQTYADFLASKLPPFRESPPSGEWVLAMWFVFSIRALGTAVLSNQELTGAPDWQTQPQERFASAFTGLNFREFFASTPIFWVPVAQMHAWEASRTEIARGVRGEFAYFVRVWQAGPFRGIVAYGPATRPVIVPPVGFEPPGFGGSGSSGSSGAGQEEEAAGITWTSTTVEITEAVDILLSLAYSVRQPGSGGHGSGIEVKKDGVSYAQLELADFRKGAQFQDRPLTLVPGSYQFIITLAKADSIEAAIARIGGDSYVCNCPDWNRKSKSFPSRYPSELRDRDWSTSGAGARGDCKHIMRVRLIKGEALIPDKLDDLDTIRQWRKDDQAADRQRARRERGAYRQRKRDAQRELRQERKLKRLAERKRLRQIDRKYKRLARANRPKRQRRRGRKLSGESLSDRSN